MSIFTAVPGGTFLGNMIRSAASSLSGGILGQGKDRINADGSVGNGDNTSWVSDALATIGYVGSGTPQGQQIMTETVVKNTAAATRNNWILLAIISALVGGCIFLLINRKP